MCDVTGGTAKAATAAMLQTGLARHMLRRYFQAQCTKHTHTHTIVADTGLCAQQMDVSATGAHGSLAPTVSLVAN